MEISDVLMVMILLFFLLSMCMAVTVIEIMATNYIYTNILIIDNGRQYGMVIIHVMIHNY